MTIDLKRALSSGNSGDNVAAGLGIGDSKLIASSAHVIAGDNGEILISRANNRAIDRKLAPNYFKAGLKPYITANQLTDANNNTVVLTSLDTYGKYRFFRMPNNWNFNTVNNAAYPLLMDLPNGRLATIFYRSQTETDDDYHWVTTNTADNREWTVGQEIFDGDHNGPGERPVALYSFLNRNYLLVRSHDSNTLFAYRSTDLNSAPTQFTSLTGLVGETWGFSVEQQYFYSFNVSAEEFVTVNNGVVLGIMSRSPSKVLYRTTNGINFTPVTLPSGNPECMRYLDNKFVVTTSTGRCYYSTDLENWLLAFNLNDGSLVDTSFTLIDGYWVFNRRSPSFYSISLPVAGNAINQSTKFNACYVTNSLSNPSISINKAITINATIITRDTVTQQTTLSAVEGFNVGNAYFGVFSYGRSGYSIVRLGNNASGGWWSAPQVSKNSDIINWLLSDDIAMPNPDAYETSTVGFNQNTIRLSTKSGKEVAVHPSVSSLGSLLAYYDPTMPDEEETITLPALDRRFFKASSNDDLVSSNYDAPTFLEYFDKQVYTRIN